MAWELGPGHVEGPGHSQRHWDKVTTMMWPVLRVQTERALE